MKAKYREKLSIRVMKNPEMFFKKIKISPWADLLAQKVRPEFQNSFL
jgi:hypothetical protein